MTSTLIERVRSRIVLAGESLRGGPAVTAIDRGTAAVKVIRLDGEGDAPGQYETVIVPASELASSAVAGAGRKDNIVTGIAGPRVRTLCRTIPGVVTGEAERALQALALKESGEDSVLGLETDGGCGAGTVVMSSAPAADVRRLVADLEEDDIAVDNVFTEPLAVSECLRFVHPETKDRVVSSVNIGETWTHIAVLDHGRPAFSRSVRMGISEFVSNCSRICDRPESEIRRIINTYGIDISDLPEDLEERAPVEAFRESVERLAREILRSLSYASRKIEALPGSMYISGGGALVDGLGDALGRATGLTVEKLDPFASLRLGPRATHKDKGPAFVVALGLALLSAKPTAGLMPRDLRGRKTRNKRLAATAVVWIIAAVTLAVGWIAFSRSRALYRETLIRERRTVESLMERLSIESGVSGALDKRQRVHAYSLVRRRQPVWGDVLRTVAAAVPPGAVLNRLSLSRGQEGETDNQVWRLDAGGVIVDQARAPEILTGMRRSLEASSLMEGVSVVPLGSTVADFGTRRVEGAVNFELKARLE
jgi:hypothetical protein